MEFNKVSSSKLRVSISEKECGELGLRRIDGDYDTVTARDAVRTVISRARDAVNFKSEGERLLIQLYPLKRGGAEMLITMLSIASEKEREAISEARNLTTYQGRDSIYHFLTLNDLVKGAKAVRRDAMAEMYLAEDGSYYLSLPEEIVDGYSSVEPLTEFGIRVSASAFRSETEHVRLIFSEIALSTLAKM